jgi:glycosyltransferase involved in cell wall biosynthesis
MEQTFQDIEYIFINDNTPDNSIEILQSTLKEYPGRDVQIITHNTNRGLALTRRTGINNAKGNYILMCDSDDYIEPDMVQLLYEAATSAAQATPADIAVCDIFLEYSNEIKICKDKVAKTKEENFSNILLQKDTVNSLCNKLIKRSLFDNPETIVPQGMNYLDDRYVITRIYYYADHIVKVDRALYHYIKHNVNAMTRKVEEYHFKDAVIFYETLKNFLITHETRSASGTPECFKQIAVLEMQTKLLLLWGTKSSKLRYKYSSMFPESEKQQKKSLKLSDRMMLCLSHKKYISKITSLLRCAMKIKNL